MLMRIMAAVPFPNPPPPRPLCREPAALRDFSPLNVRFGSKVDEEIEATRRRMSALPPKADKRADVTICPLCPKSGLYALQQKRVAIRLHPPDALWLAPTATHTQPQNGASPAMVMRCIRRRLPE